MAVPSTVRYPANYKIKTYYLKINKNANKLFTRIICYKILKLNSYETYAYYNSPFCKRNICVGGNNNRAKSSYGPVLHFYICAAYSRE
jgi:hypothetical protein